MPKWNWQDELAKRDARIAELEAALHAWNRMMHDPAYDLGEMVAEFDNIALDTLSVKKVAGQ